MEIVVPEFPAARQRHKVVKPHDRLHAVIKYPVKAHPPDPKFLMDKFQLTSIVCPDSKLCLTGTDTILPCLPIFLAGSVVLNIKIIGFHLIGPSV